MIPLGQFFPPALRQQADSDPVGTAGDVVGRCRKIAYATGAEAEAARHVLLTSDAYYESQYPLIVYRCRACALWHVGHDKHEKIQLPERAVR